MTLVAAFIFVAFLLESSKLSGLVDHPLSPLCFAISALRIPDLVVAVLAHKAVVPKLAFILLALSWTPLIGAGADVYMYMYMYYNTNIYIYIYTHTHHISSIKSCTLARPGLFWPAELIRWPAAPRRPPPPCPHLSRCE